MTPNAAVNMAVLAASALQPVPPPALSPSAQWNGTAGSGFGTANPAAPTDPTRTTAKPIARLMTPPNQWFTNTLIVGVDCAANNNGTLGADMGIEKVEFFYEGNVEEVTEPKWQAIPTERGTRLYFGWWVTLTKIIGEIGAAQLYVRVTAHDDTMQQRVLGPYNFSPQDSLHDATYPVSSQAALQSAIATARAASRQNPLFEINTAGTYNTGTDVGTSSYTITGRYTVRATVAGVKMGKTSYTTDVGATMIDQRTWWRFAGSNLTFDARYSANLTAANLPTGPQHWMDGILLTNSAGRTELTRGRAPIQTGNLNVGGSAHFTECVFEDIFTQANYASTLRGCTFNLVSGDCMSNVLCAQGNTWRNHDSAFWNVDALALTVEYAGPEETATLSRSGGNAGFGGGLFQCVIGTDTYTFDVGNGSETYYLGTATYAGADGVGGYWTQDVVDWLNTLPDVAAVISDEFAVTDRYACALSVAGLFGQGFGTGAQSTSNNTPRDIKSAPLQLVWNVNTHGDWYQHTSGRLENVIIRFNRAFDMETQVLFLSPILSGGVASTRDFAFIGNLHANNPTPFDPTVINATSQFIRTQQFGHVIFAHNTMSNSGLNVNGLQLTDEGYTLITNNSLKNFRWTDNTPIFGWTITRNRLHGSATAFEGAETASDILLLGESDTLYADFGEGDFTPTTLAKTIGFTPDIPEDYNRTPFPAIAVPGGIAAAALEVNDIPEPPDPVDSLSALGLAARTLMEGKAGCGMWDFRTASNSGLWIAENLGGNAGNMTQGSAVSQPEIDTELGAVFVGDLDRVNATTTTDPMTVYILCRKDETSVNANANFGTFINALRTYQDGSAVGAGGTFVDGVEAVTRGNVHDAIDDGNWHIVRLDAVNTSSTNSGLLPIGRSAANQSFDGAIMIVVCIRDLSFPVSGDLSAVKAAAVAWLEEQKP